MPNTERNDYEHENAVHKFTSPTNLAKEEEFPSMFGNTDDVLDISMNISNLSLQNFASGNMQKTRLKEIYKSKFCFSVSSEEVWNQVLRFSKDKKILSSAIDIRKKLMAKLTAKNESKLKRLQGKNSKKTVAKPIDGNKDGK